GASTARPREAPFAPVPGSWWAAAAAVPTMTGEIAAGRVRGRAPAIHSERVATTGDPTTPALPRRDPSPRTGPACPAPGAASRSRRAPGGAGRGPAGGTAASPG